MQGGRQSVWLSMEDVGNLCVLAKLRNRKEDRIRTDVLRDDIGAYETHIIGLLGEVAFAKHFGLQVDSEVHEWHGDDGWDFDWHGKKIDVKTCLYFDEPQLKVRIDKIVPDVDVYVLCAVKKTEMQHVDIIGYATREMLNGAERKKYGDWLPMNYVMKEQELRDIGELK